MLNWKVKKDQEFQVRCAGGVGSRSLFDHRLDLPFMPSGWSVFTWIVSTNRPGLFKVCLAESILSRTVMVTGAQSKARALKVVEDNDRLDEWPELRGDYFLDLCVVAVTFYLYTLIPCVQRVANKASFYQPDLLSWE